MDLSLQQDPFTSVAPSYDAVFTDLPEARALRERIQAIMTNAWGTGETILDLGCGTGEDAMFLARLGCDVTGIDPAPGMIEQARRKLAAASLTANLRCMGAEELSRFPSAYFEGILSNFAALNNLRDFPSVIAQCARIMAPGGTAILCLLNRYSLWESCSYLLRGKPAKAVRRWGPGPVMANVGDGQVPVFYHSAHFVRKTARPWFTIDAIVGLSVVAPLPSSLGFNTRHPNLTRVLSGLDRHVGKLPMFRTLGDHLVIVLKRNTPDCP